MYGLPKTHKKDVPLCPILSMVGSSQHQLAKWLTSVLDPVLSFTLPTASAILLPSLTVVFSEPYVATGPLLGRWRWWYFEQVGRYVTLDLSSYLTLTLALSSYLTIALSSYLTLALSRYLTLKFNFYLE